MRHAYGDGDSYTYSCWLSDTHTDVHAGRRHTWSVDTGSACSH